MPQSGMGWERGMVGYSGIRTGSWWERVYVGRFGGVETRVVKSCLVEVQSGLWVRGVTPQGTEYLGIRGLKQWDYSVVAH